MDNSSLLSKIIAKIGIAILVVALFDLVYLNYLTLKKEGVNQEVRSVDLKPTPAPTPTPPAAATTTALASPQPKSESPTVVNNTTTQQTIVQTAQKEFFIPVGSGSTYASSYADLPGAQVSIDSANYIGIKSVDFEGNITVGGSNGRAYFQLYNVTAKHPVWFSEISTVSGSGNLVVSGTINLEAGQNTYQIQAKTDLVEFPASINGGRIKIVLN